MVKLKVGDKVRVRHHSNRSTLVGEVEKELDSSLFSGRYYLVTFRWTDRPDVPAATGKYHENQLDLIVVPSTITVKPKDKDYPRWTLMPLPDNKWHAWTVMKVCGPTDKACVKHRSATRRAAEQALEDMVRAHLGLEPIAT